MASTAAIVDSALREHVLPALRQHGFQELQARHAWRWEEQCVWVFDIRAVGRHFSEVTGWPAPSLSVWLGLYFPSVPDVQPPARDDQGRVLPEEHVCELRASLHVGLDQRAMLRALPVEPERKRTDLWWVDADGANAVTVAQDIAAQLTRKGVRFYERNRTAAGALKTVKAERDCWHKFTRASYLAAAAGNTRMQAKYSALAAAEAARIGTEWRPPPTS